MNEQDQAVEEALPENIEVATPGQLLSEAREAANLSVEDISKKLHLKAALISAMEENNFDEITSVTFARGYLKSYAKLLHVDEEDILAAFEHYTTAEQQQLEMQSFSNRKGKKKLDSWLTILTALLVIGIIAAVAVWYIRNQPLATETPATDSQPVVSERASDAHTNDNANELTQSGVANSLQMTAADAAELENNNLSPAGELLNPEPEDIQSQPAQAPQTLDSQSVDLQIVSTETEDLETANPEPAIATVAPESQNADQQSTDQHSTEQSSLNSEQGLEQNLAQSSALDSTPVVTTAHLELRFEDSCWINIEDATGERIAIGTKVKGHYTSVNGVPPFTIKLGKPDAVSIWVDGQARDIPYYPKGSIANFELAAN